MYTPSLIARGTLHADMHRGRTLAKQPGVSNRNSDEFNSFQEDSKLGKITNVKVWGTDWT